MKCAALNSAAFKRHAIIKPPLKNGVVNPAYCHCRSVYTIKYRSVHSDTLWCKRKSAGVFSIRNMCHCLVMSPFMFATCAVDIDSVKWDPSFLN